MIFPHPFHSEEDGLLAYGGDLSPDTLLTAYQWGIFPWYTDPPILWWYTDPRCILRPGKVKVSKSMRSYFNQNKFQISADSCFEEVISQCANTKRNSQDSTWIGEEIKTAFIELHKLGHAHSIEVWQNKDLVGGLYGLSLGMIFFGESMFSLVSNASKFALISLCNKLKEEQYTLIDCQQVTRHLLSMGAEEIGKEEFMDHLKQNMLLPTESGQWSFDTVTNQK